MYVKVYFEFRLEERPDHEIDRGLNHAVAHRGYPQQAHAAAGLGHGDLEQGVGPVAAAQKAVLQSVDLPLQIVHEVADRHPVRPAASVVLPDPLERAVQVPALEDLVEHDSLSAPGSAFRA